MSSRQDDIIKNIALYVSKLVDRFEQGHKYSHVITQLIIYSLYVCMYMYDDVFWAGGLYYEIKV